MQFRRLYKVIVKSNATLKLSEPQGSSVSAWPAFEVKPIFTRSDKLSLSLNQFFS